MLRSETATSPERRAAALAGLKAYQDAPRDRGVRLAAKRFRRGRASLRDYGGGDDGAQPVVFVPSLINPPFVLDLSRDTSLIRWIASQGLRAYLVDWGDPAPADRAMDIAGHVTDLLVPLLRKLDRPPLLVGYCLGGTLTLAAAALVETAGVALIATPWRFSGFSPAAQAEIAGLWESAQPVCEQLGLVPMEVLQSGFWKLDPGRTIAKYERFGALAPDSEAARSFVALEDWANAGAPLTYAAGRQMFDDLFDADLPGRGNWEVGGARVDPFALSAPLVEFVSTTDRIVPAASAIGLPDHRALGAGHVGMIVGSRARAQLWEPLAHWLIGHSHPR
jgi:polyhydroxyalkanoate synthase subunit PhaC